jgi:hypothetical protein
MSWHPSDLVTDEDLVSYEQTILTQFGQTDWLKRRAKALEDWLFPLLEQRGFNPTRLRTRHVPIAAVSLSGVTYTDRTAAVATENGLNLATVLASSTDYLYLGFEEQFRGISVRMADNVSSVNATLDLRVWIDGWETPPNVQNEARSGAKAFGKGGAITWEMPEGVTRRTLNGSAALYWARLSLSAAPTGALSGPWAVIRRSRLAAPVTLRTLGLIFREAPSGQDGPWTEKAIWYAEEADKAFLRVADQLGPEFDTDGDDAIGEAERDQTAAEVSGGGLTLERY